MTNLKDKVAVVIGGSRGIGRSVVEKLSAMGADVIATYASDRQVSAIPEPTSTKYGTRELSMKVDLASQADIDHLFSVTKEQFGHLDILVISGSAPVLDKPLLETQIDEFDRVMNLNVRGTFVALKSAATHMRDSGRIVVFSTPYVVQPQSRRSVTGASKAASDALALTLAKELGPRKITVNCVMPGPTDTESFQQMVPKEMQDMLLQQMPLGRLGQAEDVADIVAFLCSDNARWITGQTIRATGGLL